MKENGGINKKENKTKKKRGFTLIELLAVIIILGILMVIAIPAVSEYITKSRKEAYVATARQYMSATRNKVNSLEYQFTNLEVMYYVPTKCIKLEKGGKSPFGEWEEAYVVVTFDGKGYSYYWTSYDKAGYGVEITKEDKLKAENITGGVNEIDKEKTVEGKVLLGEISSSTCDAKNIVLKDINNKSSIVFEEEDLVIAKGSSPDLLSGIEVRDKEGNIVSDLSGLEVAEIDTTSTGTKSISYILKDDKGKVITEVTREIEIIESIYNYGYTGNSQEFTVPASGYYNIELWGASGSEHGVVNTAGMGAYTKGSIRLEKNEKIYMYIGQKGKSGNNQSNSVNPYNGGGLGETQGGGATDVRLVSGTWNTSLGSRIMVAGGGGGGVHSNSATYLKPTDIRGNGGGLIGVSAYFNCLNVDGITGGYAYNGKGGSQTAGGEPGSSFNDVIDPIKTSIMLGTFGVGGHSINATGAYTYASSGGGGGYYGGGHGNHPGSTWCAAGGGSSFISGYAGVNAVTSASSTTHTNNTIHYSGKYFTNGSMSTGVNTGDGKAKITFVGTKEPVKVNTKLDNVRYIKSCVNGNTSNTTNNWLEIQAIKNGINVAKGKNVIGTSLAVSGYPYSRITDGDFWQDNTNTNDGKATDTGMQCVTIDLNETYSLDEVAIWSVWIDNGRIYKDNTLSVGPTNVSGTGILSTVLHSYTGTNGYVENSQGKRYSAWE